MVGFSALFYILIRNTDNNAPVYFSLGQQFFDLSADSPQPEIIVAVLRDNDMVFIKGE